MEAEGSSTEAVRPRTTAGRPVSVDSPAGEGELFEQPFTAELEEALGTAARRWPWVTPTHLLLAIFEQGPTTASDVLSTLGVSRTTVRDKLRKLLDDDER
jgi:hypothetical protein